MAASSAVPGLFLMFAATVLLIFVCVSPPTWDAVYFLRAGAGAQEVRYGVFGYTGSGTSLGYNINPAGLNDNRLAAGTVRRLTQILVLHPIAAGLSGLAFLFGLCGVGYHRTGTIFMTIVSALATLVTLVVWVIDMVLFGIARNRIRNNGIPAEFGNALWITLGALVALLLGFCAAACGIFGNYRKRRANSY
ncbi:pali-domain-containing protein [Pterulicium gracile]|uniref:Pali-domain-containing protein n=1 Tax=Pterulicium gracile TaxID=1884261 RepID=A0A5C3QMP0_9AGAR|nr:pali-domain-containing protein [Pterula gracilis]